MELAGNSDCGAIERFLVFDGFGDAQPREVPQTEADLILDRSHALTLRPLAV